MNRIKRYILLISCLLLLNGCVKNNTTMKINNDKSMNLEVFILVKDEIKNKLSSEFNSSDLEKRGFKVTTTNDNNYSGYKVTKSFDNIDELSKNNNNEVIDISKLLESDFDFSKLFNKKTNFFKDTYTANYKYSISEFMKKYNTLEDEDNYGETIDSTDKIELKYNLVLPTKAKSNNANNKTNNDKNLVWNLSSTGESKINYSFDIYNIKNIALVGGGIALLIIVLIIVIVIIKKKRNSKGTLIYKEYDPSIESELNKNEIIDSPEVTTQQTNENTPIESNMVADNNTQMTTIVNEGPQVLETLEFSLPEEEPKNHVDMQAPRNEFQNNNVATQDLNMGMNSNTNDYNTSPDYVRQNDHSKFINSSNQFDDDEENTSNVMTNQSELIDIPNGIALSDIDDNK